ncbi:MAG: c-type cytochrome [Candidatus Methylomirabilales bacterium]
MGRWVLPKVSLFALAVIGVYTYYANSIPQIESRPPEELTLESGQVSPQELRKAGEKIFYGKGTCAVCHAIGQKGQRAPDLQGVGARAGGRQPGIEAKAYLIQSLMEPGAYIVEGYGNIMPQIHKPPIGLNRSELWAVVAFLQSLGGTSDVKFEDIPAIGPTEAAEPAAPKGNPENGRAIFVGKGACIACHKVAGLGGPVGPDLTAIGAVQTVEYLEESILEPNAKVVPGFQPDLMPKDVGDKLSVREFNDLIAYLVTLKGETK